MNRLPVAKRGQMLCEGNLMRSVSRMTDTSPEAHQHVLRRTLEPHDANAEIVTPIDEVTKPAPQSN
jgi:hypothetical protein